MFKILIKFISDFNPFETKSKVENKMMQDDEAPLPAKGGYNMDFDKFDDPSKLFVWISAMKSN